MEVDGYSAKSGCYGAFERRRETSTMEDIGTKIDGINNAMEGMKKDMKEIKELMLQMLADQRQTPGERLRAEKAAVIIQAFLRTTAVRVKLDRAKQSLV